MAPAKETAEEQLLRMIEGPGGPPSNRGPAGGFPFGRLAEALRANARLLWRWLALSQESRDRSDTFLWRLRISERVGWVILAVLGLYLVVDLVFLEVQPPPLVSPRGVGEPGTTTPAAAEDQLKPLASYREAITTRNPFGLSGRSEQAASEQGTKSRLAELTGTLVVVGINRGRIPEALIEDTAAQRTYVVKIGDQLNGLTVESIDQQGVVLSYEGEETLIQ